MSSLLIAWEPTDDLAESAIQHPASGGRSSKQRQKSGTASRGSDRRRPSVPANRRQQPVRRLEKKRSHIVVRASRPQDGFEVVVSIPLKNGWDQRQEPGTAIRDSKQRQEPGRRSGTGFSGGCHLQRRRHDDPQVVLGGVTSRRENPCQGQDKSPRRRPLTWVSPPAGRGA